MADETEIRWRDVLREFKVLDKRIQTSLDAVVVPPASLWGTSWTQNRVMAKQLMKMDRDRAVKQQVAGCISQKASTIKTTEVPGRPGGHLDESVPQENSVSRTTGSIAGTICSLPPSRTWYKKSFSGARNSTIVHLLKPAYDECNSENLKCDESLTLPALRHCTDMISTQIPKQSTRSGRKSSSMPYPTRTCSRSS